MGEGRVAIRPVAPEDAAPLLALHETPAVREWWGPPEPGFPVAGEDDSTRFSILVDGRVAGLVQYGEEDDPMYRHATVDVFLDPALHRQGLGTEAIRLIVRHLVEERGHHRITIDPAAENAPAIRSYEKAGFRPVGIMEAAWRDEDGRWRDTLLMELVDRDGLSRT